MQLYSSFLSEHSRGPSFYFVGHRPQCLGLIRGSFHPTLPRSVYLLKLLSVSVAFSQHFDELACVNCRLLGSELVDSLAV